MPKAKKTAQTTANKKRTKKTTDSEEEWDAKPLKRKVARKKKKNDDDDQWGRYNLIDLQPYIDRFDSMCQTYNGYNKVVLLAQKLYARDLAKQRMEREALERAEVQEYAERKATEMVMPDMMSSMSSPSSTGTRSTSG